MLRVKKAIGMSLLILFFTACAGDPPKPTPVHLSAGAEQIKQGGVYYQKGCYKRALEHYLRAYELCTAADQSEGAAMSLNNIGSVFRAMGNPADAISFYSKSRLVYEKSGDREKLAQVLSNTAAALIDLGRLSPAEALLNRASELQAASDERSRGALLTNRGILLMRKGRHGEAGELLKKALGGPADAGSPGAAGANFALGNLMMTTGNFSDALRYFEAALKADRRNGFYKGIADDLAQLGHASRALGDDSAAADFWERSLHVYALLGLTGRRDELAGLLRALPRKDGSGEVTAFFLDRWGKGKQLESPCE